MLLVKEGVGRELWVYPSVLGLEKVESLAASRALPGANSRNKVVNKS